MKGMRNCHHERSLILTIRLLSGEEGTAEGVVNVLHALVAAFDDLFPNVAVVDIISKVCINTIIFSCTVKKLSPLIHTHLISGSININLSNCRAG